MFVKICVNWMEFMNCKLCGAYPEREFSLEPLPIHRQLVPITDDASKRDELEIIEAALGQHVIELS